MYKVAAISELVGLTPISVVSTDSTLTLVTACGRIFEFFHRQDCCENVYIESVVGDLSDLVGVPLLLAEESTGDTPSDSEADPQASYTWTFYKFGTRKGYVDVRWLGESSGYYSEAVDLYEIV